jgi:phosphoribosylformylglycinamidine cyclo-ligase
LPAGTAVEINKGSWPLLPVFTLMQEIGNVSESDMYRTFNMGVGMVIVCGEEKAEAIRDSLAALEMKCYKIGRVSEGGGDVRINVG